MAKRAAMRCGFNDNSSAKHYDKIKTLFKDKNVVLFIGKGIKNKFKYNIFEDAKSIEYVEGPNVNAFNEYENLLAKAVTL